VDPFALASRRLVVRFNLDKATEWLTGGDVNILARPTAGVSTAPYSAEAAEFDWFARWQAARIHTTAPGDPLFVGSQESPDRRIYVAPAGCIATSGVVSRRCFHLFRRGVPPDDWDIWRINRPGRRSNDNKHNARVTYPVMLNRRTLVYLATDTDGSGPWMYAVDVERRLPHPLARA